MNIQQKFLDLTDYTYILGEEDQLLDRLPKELIKDSIGNWYMEIGESETMFCCHLDTAAMKKEKVVHDIFLTKSGDTGVGSSGNTILGADDKAGVVLLMNLIENNVPGLYYFFIGEERGSVGSSGIVKKEPERFTKYKRCIAFDRRDYGSVITKQKGSTCCSGEFADALAAQLNLTNWGHRKSFSQDPFGIFTDSANFVRLIPECTNLSVGYFHEHSSEEVQNITYLEMLADRIIKINWEELPTVRDHTKVETYEYNYPSSRRNKKSKKKSRNKSKNDLTDEELYEIYSEVNYLMQDALNMYCDDIDLYPDEPMIYVDYFDDNKKATVIIYSDGTIKIGKDIYTSVYDIEQTLKTYYNYTTKNKNGNKYTDADFPEWNEEVEEADYEEVEDEKYGDTFNNGEYMASFLTDVLTIAYAYENDRGELRITWGEMRTICKNRDLYTGDLIDWMDSKDHNPDKTYGLMYDDTTGDFIIDDED